MDKSIYERVEIFSRKESGVSSRKVVNHSTTVEDDLGITGDDAVVFMERFFQTFNVSSAGFEFDRYFNGEGFNPFAILLFPFSRYRRRFLRRPLTLGMLATAAESGRWEEGQTSID